MTSGPMTGERRFDSDAHDRHKSTCESQEMPLLQVRDLSTCFQRDGDLILAVNGATFDVAAGRTTALIGESGSGKTVSALSIVGLVDAAPGITGGRVVFEGIDLLENLHKYCLLETRAPWTVVRKNISGWRREHRRRVHHLRGRAIGYIFQDPVSALSPYLTVREQLRETLRLTNPGVAQPALDEMANHWLKRVSITNVQSVLDSYPFQLSGGMAQRVMIALALATRPRLLIADEPTTALDAPVQRAILRLLKRLQTETGVGILLITHDIRLAATFADNVAVMYAGKIVESGNPSILRLRYALHPYTRSLLEEQSSAEHSSTDATARFHLNGASLLSGCAFHPRCRQKATLPDGGNRCAISEPPETIEGEHRVRCWLTAQELRSP